MTNPCTHDAAGPIYSALGADPDLAEIVAIFVEEMPQRIKVLETLFQAHDLRGVERAAHQLKGAGGSYGFDALTTAAERLERAVRAGQPEDQIGEALGALVALCRRVRGGTHE